MMEYGTYDAFGRLRSVLMHRPYHEFDLIEDPSKWGFAAKPNKDLAAKEFDDFVDLLKDADVDVHTIQTNQPPPPNLYYVRDLGLCTTNGLVLGNFKAHYRQGEELYLQITADSLEIPVFGDIHNTFFEGGDFVIVNNSTAAIGLERTNYAGYELVSEFVDHDVLPVPHGGDFAHLDTIFNMVREDLCLACVSVLPREFLEFLAGEEIRIIPVSLDEQRLLSADVLMLENNKVIIAEECESVAKELEKEGVDVITTKLHELKKGKGGPGCMVLTLLRK